MYSCRHTERIVPLIEIRVCIFVQLFHIFLHFHLIFMKEAVWSPPHCTDENCTDEKTEVQIS